MVKLQRPLLGFDPRTLDPKQIRKRVQKMYFKRNYGIILHHILFILLAPFLFSWRWLFISETIRFFCTCFGITLSYHRQLTHRSFKTSKFLEYVFAFLGCQAGQGPPIEWVCNHRYHHLHTDTPLDPHSPYEGFWWSHLGWIMDGKAAAEKPYFDYTNVKDMTCQPFYMFLERYWFRLLAYRAYLTFFLGWFFGGSWVGGMAAVCWTMSAPMVVAWHFTSFVNSAAHIWGRRPYETGDLSTNLWWVALGTYGEGWHNAHHAFPFSARHGLEWWELDITWMIIRTMQALGLAWDVQLPTPKQREMKRRKEGTTAAAAPAAEAGKATVKRTVSSTASKVE